MLRRHLRRRTQNPKWPTWSYTSQMTDVELHFPNGRRGATLAQSDTRHVATEAGSGFRHRDDQYTRGSTLSASRRRDSLLVVCEIFPMPGDESAAWSALMGVAGGDGDDGGAVYRAPPVKLPIGSPVDADSVKRLLSVPALGRLVIYDQQRSLLKVLESSTLVCRDQIEIQQRQLLDLAYCRGSSRTGAALVGCTATGIYIWRDLLDQRRASSALKPRHIRCPTTPVCLEADDKFVFTGSKTGVLSVHDLSGAEPIATTFYGHTGPITSLALLGTGIASSSEDGTIRIWDHLGSRSVIRSLDAHNAPVTTVAFSSDLGLILSGCVKRAAFLWPSNTSSVPAVTIHDAHSHPIINCRFLPGTSNFLTTDSKGYVTVWDVRRTYHPLQTLATSLPNPSVAVCQDYLVVAGRSPMASVYPRSASASLTSSSILSCTTKDRCVRRSCHDRAALVPSTFVHCRDTFRIVTTCGRALLVWSAIDGRCMQKMPNVCSSDITASCMRSLHTMFVGDADGRIHVVDYRSCLLVGTLGERHDDPVASLRCRDDRLLSVSCGRYITVITHDDAGPARVKRFPASASLATVGANWLAWAATSNVVTVDDNEVGAHDARIVSMVSLDDLDVLATADAMGTVRIWPIHAPNAADVRFTVNPAPNTIVGVLMAYCPRQSTLYIASEGVVHCRQVDVVDGAILVVRKVGEWRLRTTPVEGLSCVRNPGAQTVLVAITRKVVELYDAAKGVVLGTLPNTGRSCLSWRFHAGTVQTVFASIRGRKPSDEAEAGTDHPADDSWLKVAPGLPTLQTSASAPQIARSGGKQTRERDPRAEGDPFSWPIKKKDIRAHLPAIPAPTSASKIVPMMQVPKVYPLPEEYDDDTSPLTYKSFPAHPRKPRRRRQTDVLHWLKPSNSSVPVDLLLAKGLQRFVVAPAPPAPSRTTTQVVAAEAVVDDKRHISVSVRIQTPGEPCAWIRPQNND